MSHPIRPNPPWIGLIGEKPAREHLYWQLTREFDAFQRVRSIAEAQSVPFPVFVDYPYFNELGWPQEVRIVLAASFPRDAWSITHNEDRPFSLGLSSERDARTHNAWSIDYALGDPGFSQNPWTAEAPSVDARKTTHSPLAASDSTGLPSPLVGWCEWRFLNTILDDCIYTWESDTAVIEGPRLEHPYLWPRAFSRHVRVDETAWTHGWSVVGTVEMWGDVLVGDSILWATHARITDLWTNRPEHLALLQSRYPDVQLRLGAPPELSLGRPTLLDESDMRASRLDLSSIGRDIASSDNRDLTRDIDPEPMAEDLNPEYVSPPEAETVRAAPAGSPLPIGWRSWFINHDVLEDSTYRWSTSIGGVDCTQDLWSSDVDNRCVCLFASRSTIEAPPDWEVGRWAVGEVELSGDVKTFDDYYMANRMRVLRLWVSTGVGAEQLRRSYPDTEIQVGRPADLKLVPWERSSADDPYVGYAGTTRFEPVSNESNGLEPLFES